jgi:NDP-sugar pyrophosphorylase family protein
MNTAAIIMAGGSGRRMRESGQPDPKPLVQVGGVPLIERNLFALFRHNFRQISVAIAADAEPLRGWLLSRGAALASVTGAHLRVLEESVPLGSIGAAPLAQHDGSDVLVVFADNLTALDLQEMVEHHRQNGAAMTIAVHEHSFRIPFGAPEIHNDRVVAFREKPTFPVQVCSGVYVLSQEALELLRDSEPCGAPALIDRLLAHGRLVKPHFHNAAWIDVNDIQSRMVAEQLLQANPELDQWARHYHSRRAGALLQGEDGLLLEWRQPGEAYPEVWDTVQTTVAADESSVDALGRVLVERLGLRHPNARAIGSFDDIDTATSRVLRHHVFAVDIRDPTSLPRGQHLRWFHADEVQHAKHIGPAAVRSLAIWTSQRGSGPL